MFISPYHKSSTSNSVCNLSCSLPQADLSLGQKRLFQDRVTIYLIQTATHQLSFCHREKGCPTANAVLCLCAPATSLEKQREGLGHGMEICKFQQLCSGHLLPCKYSLNKASSARPVLASRGSEGTSSAGSACTLLLTLNQWQQKLCWQWQRTFIVTEVQGKGQSSLHSVKGAFSSLVISQLIENC